MHFEILYGESLSLKAKVMVGDAGFEPATPAV